MTKERSRGNTADGVMEPQTSSNSGYDRSFDRAEDRFQRRRPRLSPRKSLVSSNLGSDRAFHRAEDRLERRRMRLSPRKPCRTDSDLRTKLGKSLKAQGRREENQYIPPPPAFEMETDDVILDRREKQISYGKNTVDYDRYLKLVDKQLRGKKMPRTPQKMKKYSRRQWDGLVRKWKQEIHITVADLEMAEQDDMELDTGRPSSAASSGSSWADEMENIYRRKRVGGSTSSDQGLFSDEDIPSQSSSSDITHRVGREVGLDNIKNENLEDSEEDFIDA